MHRSVSPSGTGQESAPICPLARSQRPVFLVNCRLSPFPAAPSPHCQAVTLLGHPFFQRYGVNLPSSLTEAGSFTWGEFSRPTGVGVRYGQSRRWLAAFLGGLGAGDFRRIAPTRASRHDGAGRLCRPDALRPGSPACPFAGFTFPTASPLHSFTRHSGAGLSDLLAIAYDYNVLGLGPDSPWDD